MRNIFYTREFNEEIKEDVNVVLSPQFYWIKKIDIPVKNIKEAKKIAPNILKLKENEYFFKVVEIEDSFFAVAIKKDLNLNIDKKYIKSIRIAQCEFNDFDCFNLPNKFSIKKVNGIFFCFPNHYDECVCINNILEKITLSKCEFNFYNSINLSKNYTVLLFVSLFLLFTVFLSKGIIYQYQLVKLDNEYNSLAAKGLPLTTYQLNSIIDSEKEKISHNEKFRKILNKLQNLILNQDEFIKVIDFNGKKIKILIKTKRNLDSFFKKYFPQSYIVKYKLYYKVIINVK